MGKIATLTYGELPSEEVFDAAWGSLGADTLIRGKYGFGNDRRVGTCMMDREDLWQEIVKAHGEFTASDLHSSRQMALDAGDWCSCVLETLGIEWA